MSRKYKFHNPDGLYFISFATVGWADVFTRRQYKDLLVDSLSFCQREKGLELHAWCVMSNHVHLIASSKAGHELPNILRDFKKYTAAQLLRAITDNPQESRKEWLLKMFEEAGRNNSNNGKNQFWQQHNKPIELYSNAVINQKLDYIHNNPVEAGLVENAEDYLYSSARSYAGIQGLLKVEKL